MPWSVVLELLVFPNICGILLRLTLATTEKDGRARLFLRLRVIDRRLRGLDSTDKEREGWGIIVVLKQRAPPLDRELIEERTDQRSGERVMLD
jgi:hypothetical protein